MQWREADGPIHLGCLELRATALLLDGRENGGAAVHRSLAYDDLTGVRTERWRANGHTGQPALVLERPGGAVLVTSAVMHAGVVQELVDRLAVLALVSPRRTTAAERAADAA